MSNSPTVVSNVVAGAALAVGADRYAAVALLALALVLFYTAGMVLNDVWDESIDRAERPERPLPSGEVSRQAAVGAVVLLFGAGSALLLAVAWAAFLSGLVLILVIVSYDAWHKGNPVGPLLMALARALVYVTAFLALSPDPGLPLLLAAAALFVYVASLTAVAKSERRAPSGAWPVALLLLGPIGYALADPSAAVGGLVLVLVGWTLYAVSFVHRASGRDVGAAVGHLIAGISLLDAVVVTSAAGLSAGTVLCLAAFALTLFLQRHVPGT